MHTHYATDMFRVVWRRRCITAGSKYLFSIGLSTYERAGSLVVCGYVLCGILYDDRHDTVAVSTDEKWPVSISGHAAACLCSDLYERKRDQWAV